MNEKKIYITGNNQGYFVCASCGFSKDFDASKFKNTKKDIKVKCKCGIVNNISLEFRTCYRKDTNISAKCYVKTEQSKTKVFDVIIKDLSQTGLCFKIINNEYALLLHKDDNITIVFTLHSKKHTIITKNCDVKFNENGKVGVQFCDDDFQKYIGFYLMH